MRTEDVQHFAEQATLGALVRTPETIEAVRAWLRAGDFADGWHADVYTALLERHLTGAGIDLHSLAAVLVDRFGPARAHLPQLMDIAAVTPDHPDAPTYARMVVDSGLRREIAGLGVLLRAGALQTAQDRTALPLTRICTLVDAGLDVADARWAHANGTHHDDVVVPLDLRAATRDRTAARLAADKYLSAHPPRDEAAEREHVALLVGTLLTHPQLITDVATWLPVTRVEDPGWRALYATMVEVAELGQRVDVLTVAWTAHARCRHVALPSLRDLRTAADTAWLSYPPDVIRTVAVDQARRLADNGAAYLGAASQNPTVTIGDLLDAGHTVTTALRSTVAPLPDAPTDAARTASAVVPVRTSAVTR